MFVLQTETKKCKWKLLFSLKIKFRKKYNIQQNFTIEWIKRKMYLNNSFKWL